MLLFPGCVTDIYIYIYIYIVVYFQSICLSSSRKDGIIILVTWKEGMFWILDFIIRLVFCELYIWPLLRNLLGLSLLLQIQWSDCNLDKICKPIYIYTATWIKYIYLIYIYLLLLYNSSILDIEHSPYYIALGSTHTYKVM